MVAYGLLNEKTEGAAGGPSHASKFLGGQPDACGVHGQAGQ